MAKYHYHLKVIHVNLEAYFLLAETKFWFGSAAGYQMLLVSKDAARKLLSKAANKVVW